MIKIYLITNKNNGKKYIGQTKYKGNRRWTAHKAAARKGLVNKFYNAIRKHGSENFEVTTIEEVETREEANKVEEIWIKVLKTTDPEFGYNTKSAAEGKELPQSVKDKISRSHRQRFIDNPDLREQRSGINKGRVFSEEAKANMSKAHMGIKLPKFTDEHKQRISESNKLAWENRERELGPRPEEVKLQITEGLKKYQASLTPEEKELRSQKARAKALAYYAKKKLESLASGHEPLKTEN